MPKTQMYQGATDEQFTSAAGESSIYETLNLHTLMEAFSTDASTVRLKAIRGKTRLTMETTSAPNVAWSIHVIQTSAGSLTEGHYAEQHIDHVLENACSDEVGWEPLTRVINLPILTKEGTNYLLQKEVGWSIPQKLLRLLEREVGTEYTQYLSIVLIAYTDAAVTYTINTVYDILYDNIAKDITIR